MRKALFATVVAGGIAPFLAVGCTSNNGPSLANNTSSDWFGVKKLAGLFKSDAGQISATDVANPNDPTSLAHKGKPPGADLYVATARLYEKQNNLVAADDQYKRALAAAPTDLTALLGYGHLLDRQGKLDEATNYYQQAVQHHPPDASAHNDLGLCYARRGMLNESLVELSKAVELQPQKKLYRNNIATVFVELRQPQRALEHLMVAEQPAVAHYNLACLLHQRGQSQAAAAHFAQAAQHDPSLPGVQEWAQQLGAAPARARTTNVRPVDHSAPYADDVPHTASPERANQGWPRSGADRNWSAYDVASPQVNVASHGAMSGSGAANAGRGAAHAAMPPTPETAGSYALPISDVDTLPPVEQPVPRY